MPHTCETCAHWKKLEGRPGGIAVNVGECRAIPPHASHSWPRTQGAEYCSCHSAVTTRYAEVQPRTDKPRRKSEELPLR